MAFHDIFQNIPNDRLTTINYLLGTLHRLYNATFDKFTDDKRLVQLGSHQLRQTAFAHLQLRTNNDNRTGRIVYALTQKVLTEAPLLSFQRIGKRLKRTVRLALYSTCLTAVVEERINSLLKHTFLITKNNLGGLNLNQSFQTVVANNNATIEVVEVGGSKTATIQWH